MRFTHLTVENFGVFHNQHEFDLSPLNNGNNLKHVVVFIGQNGVGKSTLFQAINLGLYGALSLGDGATRQDYAKFILGKLHRRNDTSGIQISEKACIGVQFSYVQSGQSLQVSVLRQWERQGRTVKEKLSVLQNGVCPDVDETDYQTWINDLIPFGFSSICFFDAEKLDNFSDPEKHNIALGSTIQKLLGLDLIDRLQRDLQTYTQKHGGKSKQSDVQQDVMEHQILLEKINVQIADHRAVIDRINLEQKKAETDLAHQERLLAAEGGSYAERRPVLQAELSEIQRKIETVASQLRELSSGLLPFALAPLLCQHLSHRLKDEANLLQSRVASEYKQEQIQKIKRSLEDQHLWDGLGITYPQIKEITVRIIEQLEDHSAQGDAPIFLVQHFSEPDQHRLQEWINQSIFIVPEKVKPLGQELRALQTKKKRLEADINRAPDQEQIAPLQIEIQRLDNIIQNCKTQIQEIAEKIGALEFQKVEQTRRTNQAIDRLKSIQNVENQLALVDRGQLALRAYRDALTLRRVSQIEERLVVVFNQICRKDHLLREARINPDDFSVYLGETDKQLVSLDHFSAGERQLFALSVLKALREISRRELPLAIDTPLARLDETHRERILEDYIPQVASQVLLFATTAEIGSDALQLLEPYSAHIYRLEFDASSEEAKVLATQKDQI